MFECEPAEFHYNPIGAVHGGLACTLLDSALGCAGHTTLAAGVGYTSIDLNVRYLRPITHASGVLRATGRVVKPGRQGDLHGGRIDGCRRPRRRFRDEFAARAGGHRTSLRPIRRVRD